MTSVTQKPPTPLPILLTDDALVVEDAAPLDIGWLRGAGSPVAGTEVAHRAVAAVLLAGLRGRVARRNLAVCIGDLGGELLGQDHHLVGARNVHCDVVVAIDQGETGDVQPARIDLLVCAPKPGVEPQLVGVPISLATGLVVDDVDSIAGDRQQINSPTEPRSLRNQHNLCMRPLSEFAAHERSRLATTGARFRTPSAWHEPGATEVGLYLCPSSGDLGFQIDCDPALAILGQARVVFERSELPSEFLLNYRRESSERADHIGS